MSASTNRKSNSTNDILNQRYSIFLPLLLAVLFAVVKLMGVTTKSDCSVDILFTLDTISDCFSSAILPFVALAFIQQWVLGIDIGLKPEQGILLLLASIIHFTFYILYLWTPESLFLMYVIPLCSVITFLALWTSLNRYIKEGITPHSHSPVSPSGNPQN